MRPKKKKEEKHRGEVRFVMELMTSSRCASNEVCPPECHCEWESETGPLGAQLNGSEMEPKMSCFTMKKTEDYQESQKLCTRFESEQTLTLLQVSILPGIFLGETFAMDTPQVLLLTPCYLQT